MVLLTSFTSAISLFLAAMGHWHYGLLSPLRWTVSGCALLFASAAFNQRAFDWLAIMLAILFLFNPLAPIRFSPDTLVMIDLVTCSFFLAAGIDFSRYA